MHEQMPHLAHELRLASEAQRWAVLRMSITDGRMSDAERDHHVKAFLEYASAMRWPLDRLWAYGDGTQIRWACTSLPSPGCSSMVMVPYPTDASIAQVATWMQQIVRYDGKHGIKLIQSLLYLEDVGNRTALETAGFHEIAVLQYLERPANASRDPEIAVDCSSSLTAPNWVAYSPSRHAEFCDLIRATYEDSLDCPGLAALRDIDDVIEGHKGAGRFDPGNWFLLRNGDIPIACILFGVSPLRPSAELVYMGVHPRFRGRGIGQFVVSHGVNVMRNAGIQGITLAVDARNIPAIRLYESAGFRMTHTRRAMVRKSANCG